MDFYELQVGRDRQFVEGASANDWESITCERDPGHERAGRRLTALLLDVLSCGQPTDFKPMSAVGSGAYETRVRDASGAYRAIYVAKFEAAVYVLHAFQKKTQRTANADIELAKVRYKMIRGKP